MPSRRVKAFLYGIPGAGKWIRQLLYERHMKGEAAANARLKQDEISARLSAQYLECNGKPPNISSPRAFTEKILWRVLFERDERFTRLSDKLAVREWVARTIGEEYLIPLLGVWDSFSRIDFKALPRAFVLKVTSASGANAIVEDARKWNRRMAKRKFDLWMRYPYPYFGNFEMHYLPIKPRILAETYLRDDSPDGALRDYKFLCFHEEPRYVWVDLERRKGHLRNVYDMNWARMPWILYFPQADYEVPRPECFEEMIRVARALCQGFDHVRVDLYNVLGRVYFGEMTFTTGNGHLKTEPGEVDFLLGDLW